MKDQRQLLQSWRVSIRQIGYDIGRKGMKDMEQAIAALEISLSEEERERLEEPYQPHRVLGHS